MKTAVIYARYSSEKQTEQSIEGQIRECTEYAKYNDIVILDKYIDRVCPSINKVAIEAATISIIPIPVFNIYIGVETYLLISFCNKALLTLLDFKD